MSGTGDANGVLLGEAWGALGGDPDLLDLVKVTGDGAGLLPSSLPAVEAMVTAVSASTLAASVLDACRRGAPVAPVRVDVDHVAVAARSERYARREGAAPGDPFAPLSRFWPTTDGWLRLHANYPWHRDRALEVLGCGPEPGAVEAATRRWRGVDLEDALADAGALGVAVRSQQEWAEHPQGIAVADLALVESSPGRGPGRAVRWDRAACGMRVLDLTRVIAGPVATRTLAAWGADVLRLDSPHLPELPSQALDTLPGKRSATLDLAAPEGRARLEDLLAEADLVIQGYRPGALARFGLAADDLADRHPHLSVVTISAWGSRGPWAQRRGFDSLVQCATGIAAAEGTDGVPGALPAQVLDHATGHLAAAASLLALADVECGDPPRRVDLSLAQTARWLTSLGTSVPDEPRPLPTPDPYLTMLPGAPDPVQVVAPPGRTPDLVPYWSWTTTLGSDPPRFPRRKGS